MASEDDVIIDPNDPRLPINQTAAATATTQTANPFDQFTGSENPFDQFTGGEATTQQVPELAGIRQELIDELRNDPSIIGQLFSLTKGEVGGQGAKDEQAFIESVFNRAHSRHQPVSYVVNDRSYYAALRKPLPELSDKDVENFGARLADVVSGSNISNFATGNASGSVGFNGGPTVAQFSRNGDRFGIEGPDRGWWRGFSNNPFDEILTRGEEYKVQPTEQELATLRAPEGSPEARQLSRAVAFPSPEIQPLEAQVLAPDERPIGTRSLEEAYQTGGLMGAGTYIGNMTELPYTREAATVALRMFPAFKRLNEVAQVFPKTPAGQVSRGIEQGLVDQVAMLSSPTNLALIAGGGALPGVAGRVVTGWFMGQMARQLPTQFQEFLRTPSITEKTRLLIGMASTAGIIGLGARGLAGRGRRATKQTAKEAVKGAEAALPVQAPPVQEAAVPEYTGLAPEDAAFVRELQKGYQKYTAEHPERYGPVPTQPAAAAPEVKARLAGGVVPAITKMEAEPIRQAAHKWLDNEYPPNEYNTAPDHARVDRIVDVALNTTTNLSEGGFKISPSKLRAEVEAALSGHLNKANIGEFLKPPPPAAGGVIENVANAETGRPFASTLYRGERGRTHPAPSVYAQGQHWTPDKDVAETYSENIRTQKVQLNNPYVIDLPKDIPYYDALKREFGTWNTEQITNQLKEAGHDGLIVKNVDVIRGIPRSQTTEVIVFNGIPEPPPPATGGVKIGGPGTPGAGETLASYEKRAFAERFQQDKAIAQEIRDWTGNRYYEPIPNNVSVDQANEIINTRGVGQSIVAITDPTSALPFRTRSFLAQILIKRLNQTFKNLKDVDPVEADRVMRTTSDIAEFLGQLGTETGQGLQSFARWKDLTPEGKLYSIRKDVGKVQGAYTAKHGEVRQILDIANATELKPGQKIAAIQKIKTPVVKKIWPDIKKIVDASRQGILNEDTFYQITGERLGVPSLTAKKVRTLFDLAEKVDKAAEGIPKDEATFEMAKFINSEIGFDARDIPLGIYYGNILSGYNTQLVNAIDTFQNVISEINGLALTNPRAAAKIYGGLLQGFKDGRADFALALTRGRAVTNSKWMEIPRLMDAAEFGKKGGVPIRVDTTGKRILKAMAESKVAYPLNAWKYVGRLMSAFDAFNARGAYEAKSALLADRLARKEGLRGDALDSRVKQILGRDAIKQAEFEQQARLEGFEGIAKKARVNELMYLSRSPSMRSEASEFAGVATYNHEPTGWMGVASKSIESFGRDLGPRGEFVRKVLVPFTRIVANVTNRGLNYTPVGYVRGLKEPIGSDARAQYMARANMGMIGLSLLEAMQVAGAIDVNGAGPSDPERRRQLQQAGWKPYSIRIGDHYISYLYTPLNLGLSTIGNVNDVFRYNELNQKDAVTRGVYAMTRIGSTVFSQSFLSSLSTLFRALSGGPGDTLQAIKSMGASTVSGFTTPTVARDVYRWFDPKQYSADNLWGDLLRNTVFTAAVNKPQLNAFGEPVQVPMSRFYSHLSDDPAWRIVVANNLRVPVPSKTTEMPDGRGGKRPINSDEYYAFLKMSGPKVKKFITGRPLLWGSLPNDKAQDILSKETAKIRQQVLVPLRAKAARGEPLGKEWTE